MSDWWLDELAHAGAEHLDAEYVAGYERKAAYGTYTCELRR